MNFKVGDKVVCIVHYNNIAWPKGWKFVITDITEWGNEIFVHGKAKSGKIGNIHMKNCRLAEEPNIDELFYKGVVNE